MTLTLQEFKQKKINLIKEAIVSSGSFQSEIEEIYQEVIKEKPELKDFLEKQINYERTINNLPDATEVEFFSNKLLELLKLTLKRVFEGERRSENRHMSHSIKISKLWKE